jgi:hypothetical protein
MLNAAAIADLRQKLHGTLLTPDAPGYDATRKVFNAMVDKRPALIARCADASDVVAGVNFARDHGVLLSVRGGGHNFAGKAVCEGGLMLDFTLMKGITIDPTRRLARAQAGLNLGEFDRATQKYGLATTLGVATTTGISGLTLGGGYGYLAGKYGLACDNLTRAEIVTADGKIQECSAAENPELFWGLRGAGANFGVVTQFEYALHPLSTVLGGPIFYPLGRDVFHFYEEFSRSGPTSRCNRYLIRSIRRVGATTTRRITFLRWMTVQSTPSFTTWAKRPRPAAASSCSSYTARPPACRGAAPLSRIVTIIMSRGSIPSATIRRTTPG